jgi:hypothetical protein
VSLPALKNSQLEQLNSDFFAWLSTRFSALKIDHLIKQIGIIPILCIIEWLVYHSDIALFKAYII